MPYGKWTNEQVKLKKKKREEWLVTWSLGRKWVVVFCPPTCRGFSTCISSKLISCSWLMSIDDRLEMKFNFLFLLNISSARFMIVNVIKSTDGWLCRNMISVQCYLLVESRTCRSIAINPLKTARFIFCSQQESNWDIIFIHSLMST